VDAERRRFYISRWIYPVSGRQAWREVVAVQPIVRFGVGVAATASALLALLGSGCGLVAGSPCDPQCSNGACGTDGCAGGADRFPDTGSFDPGLDASSTDDRGDAAAKDAGAVADVASADHAVYAGEAGSGIEGGIDGGTDATAADHACAPQCADRQCGADGCGGDCGNCADTSQCTEAGRCELRQFSINCPVGQRCTYSEHTATEYSCAAAPQAGYDCQTLGQIGTYQDAWDCKIGCTGGNCSCGEQYGRDDVAVAACERCIASCQDGVLVVCQAEASGGCLVDGQLLSCTCQ